MTSKVKKSTKKFQHRHLKGTLERRKEFSKVKQKAQIKAKRKERIALDRGADSTSADPIPTTKKRATNGVDADDEDYANGGVDVPETKKRKGKSKDSGVDADVGNKAANLAELSVDDFMAGVGAGEESDVEDEADRATKEESDDDEDEDKLVDDMDTHKQDLEALRQKDPEFYKYLHENDAELLDFQELGDLSEVDALSGDEADAMVIESEGEDDERRAKEEMELQTEQEIVTVAMIAKWHSAMKDKKSLRAMRNIVLAFRAAASINAAAEDKRQKYSLVDADAYHDLLVAAMTLVPTVLAHHLPIKETSNGRVRVALDSKKFRTLTPLMKSFTASLLQLLETLSDGPTIRMTLGALEPMLPYMLSFKKIMKVIIQTVANIYTTPVGNEESTTVRAFLLLRRLASIGDNPLREAVLKQSYQGLLKGSRQTNTHTIGQINLVKNSCVDLWSLDPGLSYTTGFVYIRQLAIHLRTAIVHPTKDSSKTVYNWQYIHSLDFWSRVLSSTCSPASNPLLKLASDSPLHPLIYPVVQITLGALRLVPTPAYFPLRFHLTRALLRLSFTTNTYIPLAPSLLEVLGSPELCKSAKASTLAPLDFSTTLHAPKSYLRTRTYQFGLAEQIHDLLTEFFACWAKNIAFPELTIPPTVMLKRWLKSTHSIASYASSATVTGKKDKKKARGANKDSRVTTPFHLLLSKMSENAEFIQRHRAQVTFAPSNRAAVDAFLKDVEWSDTPLGAYLVGVRVRAEVRDETVRQGQAKGDGNANGRAEALQDDEMEDA